VWSLLNVIPSYSSYLHLGARDYMRFMLPRLEARGEEEEAQRVEAAVFWGALSPNTALLIALAYLCTRYPFHHVGRFSWAMYTAMVRQGFPLAVFAFLMTLMIISSVPASPLVRCAHQHI